MHGDDDDEEWLARERKRLSTDERIHGGAGRVTSSGFPDRRSQRRKMRVVPILVRVHPRVKAITDAIMDRDDIPSVPVFFELMLEAYQRVSGALDASLIPSDDELARMIETGRLKSDE